MRRSVEFDKFDKEESMSLLQEALHAHKAIEQQREYEAFIRESNMIENINRDPTKEEVKEFKRFMGLKKITIHQICKYVRVYQPNAQLREVEGLNAYIGARAFPPGGPHIKKDLGSLLSNIDKLTPYEFHLRYEALHPFTDGNGRSGRMIWAWQMREFPLGFLRKFYYQTHDSNREILSEPIN